MKALVKKKIRVAITYHYSLAFGGSERVIEALADIYPEADFFAIFAKEEFIPEKLKARRITTSFLDRWPGAKRVYRHLLPLYPLAVESLDLSGYDLIISADGAATKGVLTDQEAVHLCYCHSPPRSFWDQYFAQRKAMPWLPRSIFAPVSQYMRLWDYAAAQRIDGFMANSGYVAERIWKYYRRRSTIIYPPVDTSSAYVAASHEDYYLSAGRLVAAKRVDLLIEACNRLRRKLRIVGTGPEEPSLRSIAGPTIEFLGRVDEPQLRENYAHCRALLFAAAEDFGLVSVEAQSFGRPVIAYGRGGSLENIVGLPRKEIATTPAPDLHPTGIFFDDQTAPSLIAAMERFEEAEDRFDPQEIRLHAQQFDIAVFAEKLRLFVDTALKQRASARASLNSITLSTEEGRNSQLIAEPP
jgi:glycosyltransferase involved in cell wall biosynthesis